jgi:alpha-mannosidase
LTSVDAPAQIQVLEEGPLRATAIIRGRIGPWPFVTRVSAAAGQRRIDFQTSFEFPPDAPPFGGGRRAGAANQPNQRFRLGEPWDGRDTVRSNRRPFYDSSFKLQALFPAKLQRPTLDKNAPFDVCRSTMADTRFNAWDAIKNNIIFNWVDLLDHDGAAGLALMTDHLTAYSLTPDEPLGLVLCYAGRGIWHDYGLGRAPSVSYSIVPHAGDWARAQLWRELARWSDPLLTARHAQRPEGEQGWSLLDGSEGGLEVTTLFADGDDILIRLFNAEGDSGPKQLTLDGRVRRAWLMELDGRRTQELPVQRAADGTSSVTVTVRRLAVRTLRCELA